MVASYLRRGTKLIIVALRALAISSASSVSGEITDPQGRPVSGATVGLAQRQTKSDDRGHYFIGAVGAGEYRLTAEAPGFPILTRTISVAAEATRTENLHFAEVA